jgi:hypothetical protein
MALMEALLKIRADVQGEGKIGALGNALGGLNNTAAKVSGGLKGVLGSVGGLSGALGALAPAVGGVGLVAMAQGAINAADDMNDLAQKTGVSVEQLSRFQQAANASGTSIEAVGGAMVKLNRNLATKNEGAMKALESLGISATDAAGKLKTTDQIMLEVAGKFAKMPDGAQKSAAAMALFGKSGADMIPMLNGGRESIEALTATMSTKFAKGADELNDKVAAVQGKLLQLGVTVGTALMPIMNAMADVVVGVANAISTLPGPVQGLIGAVAALTAAFVVLAPAISAAVSIAGALAGLQLGATIAGWLGAVGPAIAGITALFSGLLAFITGTLIPGLLAVFSGPVGWTVLAVAAVVAMVALFREPLMGFLAWLWEWGEPIRKFWADLWNSIPKVAQAGMSGLVSGFKAISGLFNTYVTRPISDAWNAVVRALPQAMRAAAGMVQGVWTSVINGIRNAVRGLLLFVANAANGAINVVNNVIRGYNNLPTPDLPLVGRVTVPAFAEGGYVKRPTVGLVGEAGSEYIIPASKMQAASERFLSGARGANVIPSSGSKTQSSRTGAPVVNITTGPVMEFNGERYATMRDLEQAARATAEAIYRQQRTPAARIALGRA